ncbi:MAG TPA: hypothetical protein VGH11_08470 [Jatrophihabitans sp.]
MKISNAGADVRAVHDRFAVTRAAHDGDAPGLTRHSDLAATRGAALLSEVVEAHGGAARWAKAQTVSAHVQVRGLLPTWKFPGRPLEDYHYHQKVDIHGLRNVMDGFPTAELTCTFSHDEVRVESDGKVIERRTQARRGFHGLGAVRRIRRWGIIDSAYFVGYAMSNYMSHPYRLTRPEFYVQRGEDWRGDNQIWRRLQVEYPSGFDSHCHRETFYIDERGLIRRHDYLPDVFTEARLLARLLPIPLKAAHFTCRHREVDGLIFPTFRRVMLAPPGHRPIPGLTMICAQLSDISVSHADSSDESARPT